MKLSLVIMLWIIGQRINVGSIYWMAYALLFLAFVVGDSK